MNITQIIAIAIGAPICAILLAIAMLCFYRAHHHSKEAAKYEKMLEELRGEYKDSI